MRVLVVVDHAVGISGPHRNVVGSLNALGARDDISLRLVTGRIDETEPYARAPNLEIHVGYDPHRPGRLWSNLRLLRAVAAGCDVIYVPTNLKSLLYAQTVRKGKRLVAGPNVSHLPIRRADSPGWVELRLLSDVWFEASRTRRDHVIRSTGNSSIRCIHHAIDTEKFSPAHRNPDVWERYGVPLDAIKVLYVGRDDEVRKGMRQVLDTASMVAEVSGSNFQFVLVGAMSDATHAEARGLRGVHLLGRRHGRELAVLYASADIVLIPSSWENMPFTVLEAMASGVATVASRSGGIPEQIVDGESGLLVDIVDEHVRHRTDAATVLTDAIIKLAANPVRRANLGQGARRRVTAHFSESRLGEELVHIFGAVARRTS